MTDGFSGTIAITGMNATDNPAPGVAVARALRHDPDFSGQLIGLGYDPLDPGFYTKGLLDGGAILPYPSLGRDVLRERLLSFRERFGLQALIPTLDSELRSVASLEGELRDQGLGTFVPTLESIERISKSQLPRFSEASGVRVPESEAISSTDAIPKLAEELGLPLVIKGVYYGAYVAWTVADAIASFHYYAATWGLPVIVQRHVVGEEYNVCALGDGRGEMLGAVAMRKVALTDKGKGWAGVTVANPALLSLARQVIGALQWRGPMEVEVLAERGRDGGEMYVIEVNPRFPAWVYLTAVAGQNLPSMCARRALGLPAARATTPYEAGRMFVRISIDQEADLATYGTLTATGLLAVPARATP